MNNLSNCTVPTFRRGLRYYGPDSCNSYLIFIHDLRSWSKQRFMDFIDKELQPYKEIIQSFSKKYSPSLGIYFIIKINGTDTLKAMTFVSHLSDKLPISSKISWKYIEKLRNNRSYRNKRSIKSSVGPISDDFFSSHLTYNCR